MALIEGAEGLWVPSPSSEDIERCEGNEDAIAKLYSWQYMGKRLRFFCRRCEEWYSTSYSHTDGTCHKTPFREYGSVTFPCATPEQQEERYAKQWQTEQVQYIEAEPYNPSESYW